MVKKQEVKFTPHHCTYEIKTVQGLAKIGVPTLRSVIN